jgi:hypothetical protein
MGPIFWVPLLMSHSDDLDQPVVGQPIDECERILAREHVPPRAVPPSRPAIGSLDDRLQSVGQHEQEATSGEWAALGIPVPRLFGFESGFGMPPRLTRSH